MKRRYWILVALVLVFVAGVAAAYRLHPPTRQWITSNVIERYNVTPEPEQTFEEAQAEVDRERTARQARFKKEMDAKLKEIERLKAEKAELEKQLQDLRK